MNHPPRPKLDLAKISTQCDSGRVSPRVPSHRVSPRVSRTRSASTPRSSTPRSNQRRGAKIFSGKDTLLAGMKINKCDPIFTLSSQFRQLIAHLGVVKATFSSSSISKIGTPVLMTISTFLTQVQRILNSMIGGLMTSEHKFSPAFINEIEQQTNTLQSAIPRQREIIPGNSLLEAYVQVAVTCCREVERVCWENKVRTDIPDVYMKMLNRLTDYLVVLCGVVLKYENVSIDRF